VESIKVVLASGEVLPASPTVNSDIFYGAIGGYGGIGVIAEATLQLVDNVKLKRQVDELATSAYEDYFKKQIRDNGEVVLHNADIYPPDFSKLRAVNWRKTTADLTVKDRLIPRDQKYWLQPRALSIIASIPMGKALRSNVVDPLLYTKEVVVWKNYEASYDVAELEPASRAKSTYVLQEYFIPVARFSEFIPKMRKVFSDHGVNVINVSIRHALPDPGSLMAWAPEEVFCFVVYIKQDVTPAARVAAGEWTRKMADEILSVGGRWYLPYQIHATDDQFQRAYPRFMDYYDLKQRVDPDYRFRNKLIERYYRPLPAAIRKAIASDENYKRPEDQSFLGLPEWYIVFNSDEYAAHLATKRPSQFPYWQSAKEYWSLYSKVTDIAEKSYPRNTGYKAMLWIIGGSYTVELLAKGAWENTMGRITEALSSPAGTPEDRLIASYHKEYADFVHVRPWFEFSFWGRVKDLWSKTDFFGENFIRKTERKLWFTSEFAFKALYASLIGMGSAAAYGAEPERIKMVVKGDAVLGFEGVKPILSQDDFHFVSTPRYDVLRDLLLKHRTSGVTLLEVAGNRKILFTATGLKGQAPAALKNSIIGDSRIVTDPASERLLILSPVSALLSHLDLVKASGYEIEHLFDY
jgi:hypothetical protein